MKSIYYFLDRVKECLNKLNEDDKSFVSKYLNDYLNPNVGFLNSSSNN